MSPGDGPEGENLNDAGRNKQHLSFTYAVPDVLTLYLVSEQCGKQRKSCRHLSSRSYLLHWCVNRKYYISIFKHSFFQNG